MTDLRFGMLSVIGREGSRRGEALWACLCDCGTKVTKTGSYLRKTSVPSCGCHAREETSKRSIRDLTGLSFGKLRVLSLESSRKRGQAVWLCECECGNKTSVAASYLTKGATSSCGCSRWDRPFEDLTNRKFGRLTVLERIKERLQDARWRCLCDCGNEHSVSSGNLLNGSIQSCGCYKHDLMTKDISGERFGKLVAVQPVGRDKNRQQLWECRCDCGNTKIATATSLRTGTTSSCGCLRRHRFQWRDHRFRSRWEVWLAMKYDLDGIGWEYESSSLTLTINGKSVTYIPDFTLDNGTMIEVKGRERYQNKDSMTKPLLARELGYDVLVLKQDDLERRIGIKIAALNQAYATGGFDSCENLIRQAAS